MQEWVTLRTLDSRFPLSYLRANCCSLGCIRIHFAERQGAGRLTSDSIPWLEDSVLWQPGSSEVRTSTPSLAFGALNQSDLEIPYSLLPPSRTSSHRQLQPRRREAATLLPAGSRRLWPHSLKPPTPSSMAAHYTRRGTHTWPPPLLTCQASLTCIRMLPPPLLPHWAQPAPLLISSPPRAPPGMLQPIPPTPALWCTRSPSVLGPASSLLPV